MNLGAKNEQVTKRGYADRVSRSFQILKNAGWSRNVDDVNSIAVSGITDSCGSTSLVTEIAQSVSVEGVRTLVVDANRKNPMLHIPYSISQKPGLCDLLRGNTELEDVCFETSLPCLSVMPSGKLFRSQRVEQRVKSNLKMVLETLKFEFELVMVDMGSAIQKVANQWGSVFDRVILVAALNKFPTSQLRGVRKTLDRSGARVSGVIVNRASQNSGSNAR